MPTTTLAMRDRMSLAWNTLRGKSPIGLFSSKPGPISGEMLAGLFPGSVGTPPDRTVTDFLRAYSSSPWLRAATSLIAREVAKAVWRVYVPTSRVANARGFVKSMRRAAGPDRRRMMKSAIRNREIAEVVEHPLIDLLTNPNSWLVGLQTRRVQQTYLDLVGEAFFIKERANGPSKPPTALWPIPPAWIISTPTPDVPMWRVSYRGWNGFIPDSEILWICDPDPVNPYGRGSGVARALADELDTDEFASKYVRSKFFNRAMPDVIVWPKGTDGVNLESLKQMKQRWLTEHQGFWKAFRPFFSSREIDVKVISNTMQELGVKELREFERDACFQTFGVSPETLGVITNSNRATIDAADYLLQSKVIDPRLELWRAVLEVRLVREFADDLILDYDSPIREDREFLKGMITAYPQGFYVDDVREAAGKEPLPNDKGQVFFVPAGYDCVRDFDDLILAAGDRGLDGGGDPFAGVPLLSDPNPPADESDDPAADAGKFAKSVALKGRRTPAPVTARIVRSLEPKVRARVKAALERLKGRVDVPALAAAYEAKNVSGVVNAIDWRGFTADLNPALNTVLAGFQATGIAEAKSLAGRLVVDLKFDLTNPRAVRIAREHGARMVTNVSEATKDAIRDITSRAINAEMGKDDAVRLIRGTVGLTTRDAGAVLKARDRWMVDGLSGDALDAKVSKYAAALHLNRARMIARTEIHTATNLGQHEAWKQAEDKGLISVEKTKRVCIVTDDDRLDLRICEPMDGQEVGLDEPFVTGEGDEIHNPPFHVGCRCAQGLVFAK